MKEKAELRSKAKKLEPAMRIGKTGLNENVVKSISNLLEKRKLIKIKLLRSSFGEKDKKKLIEDILAFTRSELIESVGNVIVLHRKN